jgi:taurine--2-oxoglutarate transaminase
LVCLSKAITGGYIPFGAVWVSDRVSARYEREVFSCGLTNYAHPLGLAALDAVLDILSNSKFQHHKAELERAFAIWLESLRNNPSVSDVRYRGLLAAIDLHSTAPTWSEMIERGVYVFSKDRSIVLAPPLVAESAHLEQAMRAVETAISPALQSATASSGDA